MKKFALFLLLLLPGLAPAQTTEPTATEDDARLNSLKLYPFAFIKSRFAISYERSLNQAWSAQLGVGIVSNDYSQFYNGSNVFGFSADVQLRKYLQPGHSRLEGIYFAPHLGVKNIEFDIYDHYYYPSTGYETRTYKSTAINGGLVMGYQMHILKVVVADVYAGGGYRHSNPNTEHNTSTGFLDANRVREYSSSGVYPIMGLQIGVLF